MYNRKIIHSRTREKRPNRQFSGPTRYLFVVCLLFWVEPSKRGETQVRGVVWWLPERGHNDNVCFSGWCWCWWYVLYLLTLRGITLRYSSTMDAKNHPLFCWHKATSRSVSASANNDLASSPFITHELSSFLKTFFIEPNLCCKMDHFWWKVILDIEGCKIQELEENLDLRSKCNWRVWLFLFCPTSKQFVTRCQFICALLPEFCYC